MKIRNIQTKIKQATITMSTPLFFVPLYEFINDSQCGFKLYNYNAAVALFQNLYIKGWCHDVAIIYKETYLNHLQLVQQQKQQKQIQQMNEERKMESHDDVSTGSRNHVARIAIGSAPVLW